MFDCTVPYRTGRDFEFFLKSADFLLVATITNG